jgi:hypothetical protein
MNTKFALKNRDEVAIVRPSQGQLLSKRGKVVVSLTCEGLRSVSASELVYHRTDEYGLVDPSRLGQPGPIPAGAKYTRVEDISDVREWVVLRLSGIAQRYAHETCEGGLPIAEAWSQVVYLPAASAGIEPNFREFKLAMEAAGWSLGRRYWRKIR